ncbi:MAG: sodium:proton antiporter NhaD [Cyclobacteriaceae bacterium]
MIILFVLGYIFIALEHNFKVDKTASALITGVLCWTVLVFGRDDILHHSGLALEDIIPFIDHTLLLHIGEIAQIIFFLLAAMTIVEIIDTHQGFEVITEHIKTKNRVKLLWIVCTVTFFFSALLDNLTTAIVVAALLKKLIKVEEKMWFFGGMVIIAANAGGAWSPIGDVTTIMLWIGGQVSATSVVKTVFLPSLLCLLVPLIVLSFTSREILERPPVIPSKPEEHKITKLEQYLVFWFGVIGLLFVPIFKTITHLPPFMGMLYSLGVMWVLTELIHRKKSTDHKKTLSVPGIIRKIDTPSVLFFLGILLAVASLETGGQLHQLASWLDDTLHGDIFVLNVLVGLLSSIVDNVPLVAGATKMYSLETYPQDSSFWQLLTYCAGTGGSSLIIGSAAGVAIMGILKIDFIWYLKHISWLALLGYFVGAALMYFIV